MPPSTSADSAAQTDPSDADAANEGPLAVPLLVPRNGFRGPLTDPIAAMDLATSMAASSEPVALDAERASGYRYSQRAYLVQLRRADVGSILLDPLALGDLEVLQPAMARSEWVLHAASQDLPCLAEIGLRPTTLFDTELAGRLAGLPRVGLGPLVESVLGFALQKGHGAADWSVRPLPDNWLTYAALDVEVLIELRDAMEQLLQSQGKLDWARQEFAALTHFRPPPARQDPWRRTSGIHTVRDRRTLATIRELWLERDRIAQRRDLAPHRVLPDSAIVQAATQRPTSTKQLTALPVFGGPTQRRHADVWLTALRRADALTTTELPPVHLPFDGPPSPGRWSSKNPQAHARLQTAKAGLAELSERLSIPQENLLTPDLMRRTLWEPPTAADLPEKLRVGGAREWQIELTAPILVGALSATA